VSLRKKQLYEIIKGNDTIGGIFHMRGGLMKRLIGISIFCIILVAGILAPEAHAGAASTKPAVSPRVLQPNLPADKPAKQMMDPSFINNTSFVPTNPSDGSKWFRKNTYPITWNKNDSIKTNVKISLLQGGNLIHIIASSTPNSGNFSWTIPATIPPGDYVIKIQTVDNKFGAESYNFSIAINMVTKKVNASLKSSNSPCVCDKQVAKTCPGACVCSKTDPVLGTIRVGQEWHRFSVDNVIQCETYRNYMGWVLFDLPKLSTSIVKATLKYGFLSIESFDKTPTSVDTYPPPSCPHNVYAATQDWIGPTTKLKLLASNSGYQVDVSGQVQAWLSGKQPNYGFAFKPVDPFIMGPGDTCITTLGNFVIEIEYTEEK
jgi:hypothetical protein